jgi:hypothetical protein
MCESTKEEKSLDPCKNKGTPACTGVCNKEKEKKIIHHGTIGHQYDDTFRPMIFK